MPPNCISVIQLTIHQGNAEAAILPAASAFATPFQHPLERMKHTRAQRNSIKAWQQKLAALRTSVDTGDVNRDLLELHALDIAMIETGIYGLLALVKNHATSEIVEDILKDILSSQGDASHWCNSEGAKEFKRTTRARR